VERYDLRYLYFQHWPQLYITLLWRQCS